MTLYEIISLAIDLVTCVATIITTVIAVLSYLKDKKE